MKPVSSFKWIALVMALIIALAAALPATPAAADSSVNNEQTRVWVQFDPGAKSQVKAALDESKANVHYEFDDLNAVVVSLPEAAIAGLAKNPNVIAIEEDAPRYLYGDTAPYGVDLIQAREIWDANQDGVIDNGAPTGSGRKICIIDSGLYTGHADFAGVNVTGGYPTNTYNTDTCGHGTHVAGTIAAALNGSGVVGVTPGSVSLYIVKVFGDNCAWTYSSTLVDAANRCQAAGANIISMSLGGSTSSTLENTAFTNLYNAGILSIAAAGNDGTTATSYPAGYASVVSVAALDANKVVADFSQKNSDVEVAAPGVGVVSTVPYIANVNIAAGGSSFTGKHVEYAAYGTATGVLVNGGLCTATGAYSGKIVLCQRGDISFYDKVMNVQNSGGIAAVIYNNTDGDLNATLGEGYSSSIPAIGITQAAGLDLVASHLGQTSTVTTTITWNVSGYDTYDGTSMATPHVSGAAALIWSANTSWTNAQIRNALTATAQDLGAAGRDTSYGYGLIQAKSALNYLSSTPVQSLNVTVVTNKASYINRETVTITITVKDQNSAPVSGATVVTTITTANGTKITSTKTTGTTGVATVTHKVSSSKYGVGTYTISSTASKTGYTSGIGTKTFVVTK